MLQIGDRAPDFVAKASTGEELRSSDLLGQRALVVFFYPRDNTPTCTREACVFRDAYARFVEAGATVIGVSESSDASHVAFADKHRLPYPLVSDGDGSLAKAFGVTKTLGLIPKRVTFVIDREGIVRMVHSDVWASDVHVEKALAVVEGRG